MVEFGTREITEIENKNTFQTTKISVKEHTIYQ